MPQQLSEIKVSYTPIMTKYGVIYTPQIFVSISRENIHSHNFLALIDSGADTNLFPAVIGELIGIDVESGKKINMHGIGNANLVSYKHELNLHVFNKNYKTEIYFSYDQTDPLLGRKGFFNLFKQVIFKEKDKKVILKI